MDQHAKGWLGAPVELKASGRPADLRSGGCDIVFRLGAEQAEKLRACDDLKHGLTNQERRARTPIPLVSWGNLPQLCRTYARDGMDWAFSKADHEEAYKQLPLGPADRPFAIIAPRHPQTGIWYGFRSRTLMFGPVAAVLHYNVFSRLIAAIFTRAFGIPLICFFGDFAALLPRLLVRKGLAVFTAFCDTLGAWLKSAKLELGQSATFPGLRGKYPAKGADFTLQICLLGEKKKKVWSALILSYLSQGGLSFQEMGKLIWRLSPSQTLLLGKFARTQLRPLYQKLYRRVYNAALSAEERAVTTWRFETITSFAPRICRPLAKRFGWPFLRTRLQARRVSARSFSIQKQARPGSNPRKWLSFARGRCYSRKRASLPAWNFWLSPRSWRNTARGWPGLQYGFIWAIVIVYRL